MQVGSLWLTVIVLASHMAMAGANSNTTNTTAAPYNTTTGSPVTTGVPSPVTTDVPVTTQDPNTPTTSPTEAPTLFPTSGPTPVFTTTAPVDNATTAAPGNTTATPASTTGAPESTTGAPVTTGVPSPGTTGAPGSTTGAPESTTGAPESTTGAPVTTGVPSPGTTGAPGSTTGAPESTTEAPESSTGAPVTTGVPSPATTGAPGSTTGAPESTTGAPESTTAAPATRRILFAGDYETVVTNKTLFLSECTQVLSATCTDVKPGSIEVDLEGTEEQVANAVEQVEQNGLNLPGFPNLSVVPPDKTIGVSITLTVDTSSPTFKADLIEELARVLELPLENIPEELIVINGNKVSVIIYVPPVFTPEEELQNVKDKLEAAKADGGGILGSATATESSVVKRCEGDTFLSTCDNGTPTPPKKKNNITYIIIGVVGAVILVTGVLAYMYRRPPLLLNEAPQFDGLEFPDSFDAEESISSMELAARFDIDIEDTKKNSIHSGAANRRKSEYATIR